MEGPVDTHRMSIRRELSSAGFVPAIDCEYNDDGSLKSLGTGNNEHFYNGNLVIIKRKIEANKGVSTSIIASQLALWALFILKILM